MSFCHLASSKEPINWDFPGIGGPSANVPKKRKRNKTPTLGKTILGTLMDSHLQCFHWIFVFPNMQWSQCHQYWEKQLHANMTSFFNQSPKKRIWCFLPVQSPCWKKMCLGPRQCWPRNLPQPQGFWCVNLWCPELWIYGHWWKSYPLVNKHRPWKSPVVNGN